VTTLSISPAPGAGIARELQARLDGVSPALVLLFASPSRDLAGLQREAQDLFPDAVVLGATTAGEFSERGDAKGSVSAVAVAGDLRVHAGIGRGLKGTMEEAFGQALEPISPPLRVTRAEGARVFEVEGRPAWDVWKDHTREAAAALGINADSLEGDALGAFLLRFEAGLAAGGSYKIRAPLRCFEDGSLLFASEVPEGVYVRITESVPGRQIASAREAARRARGQLGEAKVAGALVFDCICRNLILGERFREAIAAMGEELGGAPLAGFETYGEIALGAGEMSGFHNTTSVVLAFPE
jgi:hypothetical protein